MKKVAVILSGSGVYDGSELHEAVLALHAIEKLVLLGIASLQTLISYTSSIILLAKKWMSHATCSLKRHASRVETLRMWLD